MTWQRDGQTFINTGEVSDTGPPLWADEIIGDSFTAYYVNDGYRASETYYVCLVNNPGNLPPGAGPLWIVESATHVWQEDSEGNPIDSSSEEFDYDSGDVFYYHSAEAALAAARSHADADMAFTYSEVKS